MKHALGALTLAAFAAAGSAAAGDLQAGPRVHVSDDADLGVGADVRWTFLRDDPRLALVGSFAWFFPDEEGDEEANEAFRDFLEVFPDDFPLPGGFGDEIERRYWEANLDLTWDFTEARTVIPYAGVGVNYARSRVSAFGFEEEVDDFGANVLAGVRIKDRFYVEAKQEAGGGELFVLSAGFRF